MKILSSARIIMISIGALFLLLWGAESVHAADTVSTAAPPVEYINGTVLDVKPLAEFAGRLHVQAGAQGDIATVKLTSGAEEGTEVLSLIRQSTIPGVASIHPSPGDRVIMIKSQIAGHTQYDVADYQRINYVYALIGLFILALLAVGRMTGLKCILVIAFALLIILKWMIPAVIENRIAIIPATFAVSISIAVHYPLSLSAAGILKHGVLYWALFGGVAIAGLLGKISIVLMHLSGLYTDETMMLHATYLPNLNFQDILFAGLILGALGAVMDVAISIASAQYEIHQTKPGLSFSHLFASGLHVGKDILGTDSYTLILAYLGGFLPLILLFASQSGLTLTQIGNMGLIASEVVRALAGSIGLICTIPVTAAITSFFLTAFRKPAVISNS